MRGVEIISGGMKTGEGLSGKTVEKYICGKTNEKRN